MTQRPIRIGLLTLLLCLVSQAQAQDGRYALINGRIFDGVNERIIENRTVLVAGDRIERIAPADAAIPAGHVLVDLESYYLILLPDHPPTNIAALQDVLLVMSNGRIALKRIPFAVN